MQLGFSLPKIRVFFKELTDNKSQNAIKKDYVPMQDGTQELREVYRVPLELPRYRLENTRTISQQEKYIEEHDLNEDYFLTDLLSDKKQDIQHKLLKNLIHKSGLKEYFEENVQTDPLIVTHDGFVVSGNRRLCAYRELYYNTLNGEKKYRHFKTINVLILPKVDDEQIEYMEDYYEQQEDIKQDFSWVDKALGFRRRIKKWDISTKTLSNRSRIKQNEIDNLLSKINVAERYLRFIDKHKDYESILEDEYGFDQILKYRKKFSDPVKTDTFEKLAFLALKNKKMFTGRMYQNIKLIQEIYEEIVSTAKEEFEDNIKAMEVAEESILLGVEFENDDEDKQFLAFVESREDEEDLFEVLFDKVIEKKQLDQEKKRKNAVLDKIKKASKELINAYNIIDSHSDKDGVEEHLKSIFEVANKLKKWAQDD